MGGISKVIRRASAAAQFAWIVAAAASACWAPAVHAAPVYGWSIAAPGDVVTLTQMNSRGELLMSSGQCVQCPQSAQPGSYVVASPDTPSAGYWSSPPYLNLVGLPDPLLSPLVGPQNLQATAFNAAGDVIGVTQLTGGSRSTLWRAGVAYDLTDPANAGLAFTPDADVAYGSIDLSSLVITGFNLVGPPADIAAFLASTVRGWRSADDRYIAFEVAGFGQQGATARLTLLSVPEPGSLALVAAAGVALALRRRRGG